MTDRISVLNPLTVGDLREFLNDVELPDHAPVVLTVRCGDDFDEFHASVPLSDVSATDHFLELSEITCTGYDDHPEPA